MKIIIDTNILVQVFSGNPKSEQVYTDPNNGDIVKDINLRAEALVGYISNGKGTVIIPAPVLAEYLIGIDKEHQITHINMINGKSCFEIYSFDEIAAYECANLPTLQELKQLDLNLIASKIKFDRQIVSIAKASNIDEVWTHDKNIFEICKREGIVVKSLADISVPSKQFEFDHSDLSTIVH